jgi:predicted ATP-grasp superfamily ATP-dependent carboligase
VRELGWTGVALVEFKKGDDYRLIEVNPRFWGSLPLATRAGVNFPHLLCRAALGESFEPVAAYPEGIRLRFLAMDISAAMSALGEPSRRGRYVSGFLRDLFDPRVRDGIFEVGDLPASIAYVLSRFP